MDASGKHKFRIVINLNAPNGVTLNEFCPLLNMTEILDQLGQLQLFCVIDFEVEFYQMSLAKASREYTAFSRSRSFRHMTMGRKTSLTTYLKLMDNVSSEI